jgi:hypothetical protein
MSGKFLIESEVHLRVSTSQVGSGYIILLFFCSDLNPTRLNSDQKILTPIRPDPTHVN